MAEVKGTTFHDFTDIQGGGAVELEVTQSMLSDHGTAPKLFAQAVTEIFSDKY